MKLKVTREQRSKEEIEIEVVFPYYYQYDFSPDPHTHPTYARLSESGQCIKVSEPGCCASRDEYELEIEQVDIVSHLGYVTRPSQYDYSSEETTAKDFERILAVIKEKIA